MTDSPSVELEFLADLAALADDERGHRRTARGGLKVIRRPILWRREWQRQLAARESG